MLQSEVQTAARAAHLDYLSQAALQALTAGATQAELMTSLSAALENYQARQEPLPGFLPCDAEMVFDELPPGLIDLPSAARKYAIPRRTIQTWVRTNKVRSYGRLKGSARGGGYLLVDERELVDYHGCPKSRGRPKKLNKSITC